MSDCPVTAKEMNNKVMRKLLEYKKNITQTHVSDPNGVFTDMKPSRLAKKKEIAEARARIARDEHNQKLLRAINILNRQ